MKFRCPKLTSPLRLTAFILIAIFGAFSFLGFFAPQKFHLEKSVVIHQPKDKVFSFIRKFRDTNQGVQFQLLGERPAEQITTRIDPGERIESQIRYLEPVKRNFHTYLILDVVGENRTKVIFGMTNQMKFPHNVLNFIQNVFLNFEKNMSMNLDQTLEKLKVALETKEKSL